jgi:hypothetical protein
MPRRHASQATAAQPEADREEARPLRRRPQASTKRLSKRMVRKADGRYLIYYDRSVGPILNALARKA